MTLNSYEGLDIDDTTPKQKLLKCRTNCEYEYEFGPFNHDKTILKSCLEKCESSNSKFILPSSQEAILNKMSEKYKDIGENFNNLANLVSSLIADNTNQDLVYF